MGVVTVDNPGWGGWSKSFDEPTAAEHVYNVKAEHGATVEVTIVNTHGPRIRATVLVDGKFKGTLAATPDENIPAWQVAVK